MAVATQFRFAFTPLMLSRWLVLHVALLCSASLSAATVMGIVSPRNSADVLSGAHLFLKTYPQHTLILRTTDQFAELGDHDRQQLLQQADVVFAGGVFGEAANALNGYLSDPQLLPSFIALHSDRRLVSRSRLESNAMLAGADLAALMLDPPVDSEKSLFQWSVEQLDLHRQYRPWLLAKTYWENRNAINIDSLLRYLLMLKGERITVLDPQLQSPLRFFMGDSEVEFTGNTLEVEGLSLDTSRPWVALLDYDSGDRPGERELLDQLCAGIESSGRYCLKVLAKWGEASARAVEILAANRQRLGAVVSLQNFVVGGGEGREAVNRHLAELNAPVLKAIRLTDATEDQWRLSEEGLRWDSVHYRVAMPELQGVSQPLVAAAMTPPSIDAATGLKVNLSHPIESQVQLLSARIDRWLALQTKANADKKVAIIYYNHPPGRHNIGADNLNVPASLLDILRAMKARGYHVGALPQSQEALLDLLQAKGVNLPEDRQALSDMSNRVQTVSSDQYGEWFSRLPQALQMEMVKGPLGYLHAMLQRAVKLEDKAVAQRLVVRVVEDLRHAIEGADHPARERVLKLLVQLEQSYNGSPTGKIDWTLAQKLVTAISDSGIEGLRGWGPIPGNVMVFDQRLLIPGIQFGNVFIGPQPPRGWELNEELLHANLSFPPPHQYMAFYQWLRHGFKADALIHLGRHSTYEFLPRHRVGLGDEDYSLALLGDLPSVYPYIVDGVGEGIQAKRRGLAVMVDHLTPPLDSTDLYDSLLELRQLVESFEAAPESAGAMRQRAIKAIKVLVDELRLRDELLASMSGELQVRGITDFDQVDDELLVHEVGHYLTKLQEDFMPLGLHVFGRDWTDDAVATMLTSMAQGGVVDERWQDKLTISPAREMQGLFKGLKGEYIEPAKGNDPIRTPEVLPTGRNFFALDGSLIPSRLGYEVGVELAKQARLESPDSQAADAIVLWASDVVRDEGAMIAFGLDMLGVKPVWSSRGIVKGLERLELSGLQENGKPRVRRDTVYTTSGLFRDLYGAHLVWLEKAVLMALDGSSDLIREQYPALTYALNSALKPLGSQRQPGRESLQVNWVAARWVEDARNSLALGVAGSQAGPEAAYRVFGDGPGTYGAGVNRLVERSGSWQDRSEIADVYLRRMGHAYGLNVQGKSQSAVFKQRLATVNQTYLGRSSNLYGLLDNNDSFDYLGGLSLAVETLKGQAPDNFILFHPDSESVSMEPLEVALLSELRGRYLNPQWLNPLMDEGYAGARTMGSEFLEYLWGWQVTNPGVVKSWVWDEVKAVYVDDKYDIGLDEFLADGHNAHVKANMLAIMLVAAQKTFWQADDETLRQIAQEFTQLVLDNGLPGSGHTSPGHPIYDFIEPLVDAEQYQALQQLLAATQVERQPLSAPSVVAEISMQAQASAEPEPNAALDSDQTEPSNDQASPTTEPSGVDQLQWLWMVLGLIILLGLGAYRGTRAPDSPSH